MACSYCGMATRHVAEYHPYEFCMLVKDGVDPWAFVRRVNRDLGLVPEDALPERPPLIRDLPVGGVHDGQ